MIPTSIADASPLDPLILLPLPPLPSADATHALLSAVALDGLDLPTPVAAAGMRSANRAAQTLLNAARTESAQARAHLDDVDVGLRTVEYELARVRDEMARCMEYEPMYESMDMPDEETFLSENPGALEGLPSDPEARKYALIIARLESELAAVLEHEAQLASLTAERDALVRSRREVKAKFDAVDVWLADFAKTSNAMATKIRDVTKGAKKTEAAASPAATPVALPEEGEGVPAGAPGA